MPKKLDPSHRPGAPFQVRSALGESPVDLYISRDEAEAVLRKKMEEAEIPLNSITARCMFEPTEDSRGGNNCEFGRTPLWGNEIRLYQGRALRSEFMEMVQRLIDSGHAHQRAGQASWGK